MEEEIENSLLTYTDEIKADLDNRYANYKNGNVKTFTKTESRQRVQKFLSKNK